MSEKPREFPHLPHAPITEAIIDFRVKPRDDLNVRNIAAVHSLIGTEYPKYEEKKLFEFEVGVADKVPLAKSRDTGIIAHWFRSKDLLNVAQFRRDGFTFNRLAPYTRWEQVFADASQLWRIYVEVTNPLEVSRIAVRYLNRLSFPTALAELSKYLTAPPSLPKNVTPSQLGAFFTRLVIVCPDNNIAVNVVQAPESQMESNPIQMILDIDAYCSHNTDDVMGVLAEFEKLRQVKNQVFFDSLTPEAIKLFE